MLRDQLLIYYFVKSQRTAEGELKCHRIVFSKLSCSAKLYPEIKCPNPKVYFTKRAIYTLINLGSAVFFLAALPNKYVGILVKISATEIPQASPHIFSYPKFINVGIAP